MKEKATRQLVILKDVSVVDRIPGRHQLAHKRVEEAKETGRIERGPTKERVNTTKEKDGEVSVKGDGS